VEHRYNVPEEHRDISVLEQTHKLVVEQPHTAGVEHPHNVPLEHIHISPWEHHDILYEEPVHKLVVLLDGIAGVELFDKPAWEHIHNVPWELDGIPSVQLSLAPWHNVPLARCGTSVPWLVYIPDGGPWCRLVGLRVYKFVEELFLHPWPGAGGWP